MKEGLSSKWREKKKAGVIILVSDKMSFKPTKIQKDKEGYYIMVKGSMHPEDLKIQNIYIYATNTGATSYIKQVLNNLQRDLDSYTIIVGDFNNLLSILDRSTGQKLTRISRT